MEDQKMKFEQTSRGNPFRLALVMLAHEERQPSEAPHWRRSGENIQPHLAPVRKERI